MAYQEHDDAAYAADIDRPARSASSSPTAASSRRPRTSRNRDFGLYAGRLRHHYPTTKHDDAAPNAEPLDFIDETQPGAQGSPLHSQSRYGRQGPGFISNKSSKPKTSAGRAVLGSPRSQTHSPSNRFAFDDTFDEAVNHGTTTNNINFSDHQVSPESSPSALSFASPVSPISPRWASPNINNINHNTSTYSYASSTAATASIPVSSLHTSVASTGFSTAPTSPISPTPSVFAGKPSRRSPSNSSSSAPRFPGLSSHPFIVRDPTPQRTSSSTEESTTVPVDSRADVLHPQAPFVASAFSPPPPPRSDLRSPTPPVPGSPGAMIVGNFSRPRQASIKQPRRDVVSPTHMMAETAGSAASRQFTRTGGRSRDHSASSYQSSTYSSSVAHKRSNDRLGTGRLASSAAHTNNVSVLPPMASSRSTTPTMAPYHRGPSALREDDEKDRSTHPSSALAAPAPPPTAMYTEDHNSARNSYLADISSRASLAWFTNAAGADDGLSVDDVMGMYERGFGDSTGAEDNDGPYGGPEANASGNELSDAEEHNSATTRQATPGPDSTGPPPDVSSSVAKDSGLAIATQNLNQNQNQNQLLIPKGDDADDAKERRDSAKMLDSDDKISTPLSPLPSPGLLTPQASRPNSPKPPSLFARAHNEPDDPEARDRYGFRKHNQYITREQYDAWNGPYTEYIGRRRRKWVQYLRDSGMITDNPTRFPAPSVKTKRFIRKGIPPEWRGAAWFYYAGGPSIVAKHPRVYDQLIVRAGRGEAKSVDIEAIERDLHRTFPDNVQFQFSGDHQPGHADHDQPADGSSEDGKFDITADRAEEPKIVSKLRRVLLAFSIYNPRIGYCQSLNFLAGLLLLFVETEEHCFWMLNVITRIFLPGTHEMSLEGSKVDLGVLMATLQESLPGVWAKIGGDLEDGSPPVHHEPHRPNPLGIKMKLPKMGGKSHDALTAASADRLPPITLCMTAWFMSCFIGTLPIETTLRVWDIFFYEGSKTLFRVALAIFKLGEPEIRAVADPMEMFGVVQAFPRRLLDANMLMEATFRRRNGFGHLSQENIEEKRREHRDVFKDASKPPVPVPAPGNEVMDSPHHGDAAVRRKDTLFNRLKDRRPTEVA